MTLSSTFQAEVSMESIPQVIETDRLRLRRITDEDYDWAVALESNPEVRKYLDEGEGIRGLVMDWIANWESDGLSFYVMERKSDGERLGVLGNYVHKLTGDSDFGMRLLPEFHSQGYGSEALKAAVSACFEHSYIPTFKHQIDSRNAASIRATEKMGAKKVGEWVNEYEGLRDVLKQTGLSYDDFRAEILTFLARPEEEQHRLMDAILDARDATFDSGQDMIDFNALPADVQSAGRGVVGIIDQCGLDTPAKLARVQNRTILVYQSSNPKFAVPISTAAKSAAEPSGTQQKL